MNESLLQGKKAVEVVVMMVVLDERDGRRDFPATVCPPPPAEELERRPAEKNEMISLLPRRFRGGFSTN